MDRPTIHIVDVIIEAMWYCHKSNKCKMTCPMISEIQILYLLECLYTVTRFKFSGASPPSPCNPVIQRTICIGPSAANAKAQTCPGGRPARAPRQPRIHAAGLVAAILEDRIILERRKLKSTKEKSHKGQTNTNTDSLEKCWPKQDTKRRKTEESG